MVANFREAPSLPAQVLVVVCFHVGGDVVSPRLPAYLCGRSS